MIALGPLKAEDATKKVVSLKIEVNCLKTQQERLHCLMSSCHHAVKDFADSKREAIELRGGQAPS